MESTIGKIYAQGDVLLLRVLTVDRGQSTDARDNKAAVVLAEGELTGHRHAFYGGAVMFSDADLARDVPPELYIGHIEVGSDGALLEHGPGPGQRGDHDAVRVPTGTYIALRQREYAGTVATRRVAD
jgi:hypothetical protein